MSEAENMITVQEKRTMRASPARNKTRNNKVYTAKGPRDRRIRLSADIAIQFYDVQDRLGYERASEAVDWLISKAKDSIDKVTAGSSLQQQFEHLTNSGAAQNNVFHQGDQYLTENSMSGTILNRSTDAGLSFLQGNSSREDFGASEFNSYSIDSSLLFQMANSSENHQWFEQSSMQPFQHMGHIPRMVMFNSKLNTRNEVHPFVPNYVPLMSSSVETSSDPKLNLCISGSGTSEAFSDSEQWTIF